VISRAYIWAGGSQHAVWDQSLDASVGSPKALASALARPPGVTSLPPAVVVPGPAVTSSAVARPPGVTATSTVPASKSAATTAGLSPVVSADAMLGIETATAGADAIPTVSDVLLLSPVAPATAGAHVPGVDFGGGAFVSPPRASATAAGIAPIVAANMAITVPVVTAIAGGIAPSPDNTTPIPRAQAAASGIVPGISMGVLAARAPAAAAGIVPVATASSLILPPAATATAAGRVPQVISSINGSVTVPAPAVTTSALARPPFTVVEYFDDFNRANNTSLGSDWTETVLSGSGLGINSNALTWQASTDGSAYAMRAGVLATDAFYVRIVASSGNSSSDSRIIAGCSNSGVTVFAYLNWFSNKMFFGRSTGSYTSISDLDSVPSGLSIGSGTVIEFYRKLVSGHYTYYVDIGGVNQITYPDTSDLIAVGSANRRVGAGLERTFGGQNSGGFGEFRAKDYIL